MQRVFPSKTTDANEVSVNNDNNEQFPTSDSRSNAEPSSLEVSRPRAEQTRRLASCIGTEQSIELASSQSAEHQNSREPSPEAHIGSRLSMDSIPEINRPSRQEVDSPRSIYTGERLIFPESFTPKIFGKMPQMTEIFRYIGHHRVSLPCISTWGNLPPVLTVC